MKTMIASWPGAALHGPPAAPRRGARVLLALALAAAALPGRPGPAGCVEVSLEENKASRGNIGYVDLQLLFRRFPDTEKARQNFAVIVRQAEEQVSLRKAELFGLRLELERLRKEREFLMQNPLPGVPAPPQAPPRPDLPALPGLDPLAPPGGEAAPAPSTGPAASAGADPAPSQAPGSEDAAAASSEPARAPLYINLPGMAPGEPGSTAPPSAQNAAAIAELDQKIADTTRLLNEKQADFEKYQAQVERNLLDLEGRRTEILLGRIYRAVQEVAQAEGVSVVVDKSQILFGQGGVDLTQKVLKRLREK